MRRFRCLLVMVSVMGGCESTPKDPYDEYFASQTYKDFVPPTAQKVTEGTGVLSYKAPQPGRVYVLDLDDMVTVKTFRKPRVKVVSTVDQDADVRFDPDRKEFEITGQNIMRMTKVTAGHRHEMRFYANEVKE
jgi:hypothetical protein